MQAEYIALYQATRDVFLFVSLMKEIEFVLNVQGGTPTVLCICFKNPGTVHEDDQGAIPILVSPQMRLRKNQTAIKYHYFRSFVANGDVEI